MTSKYIIALIILSLRGDLLFCQQNYFFTAIVNDTPYVIINDCNILHKTQTHLLTYLFNKNWYGEHSPVFISNEKGIVIEGLYLDYFSRFKKIKFWELSDERSALKHNLGYSKGDKLTIQPPTKDCTGEYMELTIQEILYCPLGLEAFILFKCSPSISMKKFFDTYHCQYFIASGKRSFNNLNKSYQLLVNIPIPAKITETTDLLAKKFYPKNMTTLDEPSLNIQPVICNSDKIYFVSVVSWGNKPRNGILYLFSDDGKILQKIENEKFNKIIGITDSDFNGTNEIMVFYGDGYGGGYVILNLETGLYEPKIKLAIKTKFETIFD